MKILVRGTNWIGDAVMTVPALKGLRRAFPDAEITLHSRSAAAAVFDEQTFIDDILIINGANSDVASVVNQARRIRGTRFDLGIVLTNSIEASIVQRLGGVSRRFGYATQGRSFFLTDPVDVPVWKDSRHEVYYYLNLIDAVTERVGGSPLEGDTPPAPSLAVSDERIRAAREKLRKAGVREGKRLIALGIGSTNSRAKRWPASRYAELASSLTSQLGAEIVLVGSEGDKPVADQVRILSRTDMIDLCGATSVSEITAMLATCDLLIANDMGLAHLAPAVGTGTIVIFGPTNELTTRPLSDNAEVVRDPVECSPCMLRDCPIDHRCMTGVSVQTVFERAVARLDSK